MISGKPPEASSTSAAGEKRRRARHAVSEGTAFAAGAAVNAAGDFRALFFGGEDGVRPFDRRRGEIAFLFQRGGSRGNGKDRDGLPPRVGEEGEVHGPRRTGGRAGAALRAAGEKHRVVRDRRRVDPFGTDVAADRAGNAVGHAGAEILSSLRTEEAVEARGKRPERAQGAKARAPTAKNEEFQHEKAREPEDRPVRFVEFKKSPERHREGKGEAHRADETEDWKAEDGARSEGAPQNPVGRLLGRLIGLFLHAACEGAVLAGGGSAGCAARAGARSVLAAFGSGVRRRVRRRARGSPRRFRGRRGFLQAEPKTPSRRAKLGKGLLDPGHGAEPPAEEAPEKRRDDEKHREAHEGAREEGLRGEHRFEVAQGTDRGDLGDAKRRCRSPARVHGKTEEKEQEEGERRQGAQARARKELFHAAPPSVASSAAKGRTTIPRSTPVR